VPPVGGADEAALVSCLAATHYSGKRRLLYVRRRADEVTCDTLLSPKGGDKSGKPISMGDYWRSRYAIQRELLDASWFAECVQARELPRKLIPRNAGRDGSPIRCRPAGSETVFIPHVLLQPLATPEWLHRALLDAPAQLWRLRGLLLAEELSRRLLPDVASPALVAALHEAITSGVAVEEVSYERFEILGDAWLKLATSACVFLSHPHAHEGQLTARRAAMVSNNALARAATAAGLHLFVRAWAFAEPGPGLLRRKALADVLEACLGVIVHFCGEQAAWHAARTLGVLPLPAPPVDSYLVSMAKLCSDAEAAATAAFGAAAPRRCDGDSQPALLSLEQSVGYSFAGGVPSKGRCGRLALLDEAMTHASACDCSSPLQPASLQRLEFLGDAALDFLVMRHLFALHAQAPAGELTLLRAAALNNERLGSRAAALRLATHLRHGSAELQKDVTAFVDAQRGAQGKIGCPYGSGGSSAPKVLADAAEALCGAIYLDSRLSADELWRVARRMLSLDDVALQATGHPVSLLLERCQTKGVAVELRTVAPAMPGGHATAEVVLAGLVIASGDGPNVRSARLAAAVACLEAGGLEEALRAAAERGAKRPRDGAADGAR
jgi:endoribonuclease Dicer